MNLNLVTEAQLAPIIEGIQEIKNSLEILSKNSIKDQLYTNEDLVELLKVSYKTLQGYRDKGIISFSQIGRKIYYKKVDVDDFLNQQFHACTVSKKRRAL